MRGIDLNCDLGEGAGHDADLMPLITSANIACGGHTGDSESMRAAVALALRHGVAIGAHPGLEDRQFFGRRELPVTPAEVRELVRRQIRLLDEILRTCGGRIAHVKPHGALYNMAARDAALAQAVVAAVLESDPEMILVGLAGGELVAAGREKGLRVASEAFADRTYQPDGSLTPRSRTDALIADATVAEAQVLSLVREGCVRATDGTEVTIAADTICVHGDGPHAVEFVRGLRTRLAAADIAIRPLGG
jgi:5-oxoprolinase (ATP-hydrolysing) subunit A